MKTIYRFGTILILMMVTSIFLAGQVVAGDKLPLGEPIRCGCISPMSGPFSRAVGMCRMYELHAEDVNNAGGLVAGGERHMIEYYYFDGKGWGAVEGAEAMRDAIFNKKVKFIWSTTNKDFLAATGRIASENQVLHIPWGAGYLSPDLPYLIGAQSGYIWAYGTAAYDIPMKNKDVKRMAIVLADTPNNAQMIAYYKAGAAAAGIEVVYDGAYPPDVTDMMPTMQRVLAKKPDLIAMGDPPPAAIALLLQATRDLGYKGKILGGAFYLGDVEKVMSLDYLDGRTYSGFAHYGAPGMPQSAMDLYKRFVARWGADSFDSFMSCGYESGLVMEAGIKAAQSIDPVKVREALLSAEEVEVPVLGKGKWGGEEMFGVKNHLLTPIYYSVVDLSNPVGWRNIGPVDMPGMWAEHKDVILPIFEKYGVATKAK